MARQVGGAQARVEYAAIAALRAIIARIPIERAVKVGAAAGGLAMAVDRFNRRVALRNLGIAFPAAGQSARLAILRGMYRNWGRMAAEWAHFGELDRSNIGRFVVYDGEQHWREALGRSRGHGLLVLTGHFGNFELLSLAHSIYGTPIAIVHRPLRNPLFDDDVAAQRMRFGNRIIPRRGAGREILRALRDNWMVAIPIDLDVRKGVFVDFFSLKACTTDGLARLALTSGTPVVAAFMVRQGSGPRHAITVTPQIEIVRTRDREESVRENTQRFTAIFEQMVRRYPDHWNWIHRRWKTRPPGEQRFY